MIFDEVQRGKLPVDVRCGIFLNGASVDVTLNGYFSEVEGNTALYTINKITPLTEKNNEKYLSGYSVLRLIFEPGTPNYKPEALGPSL